MEKGFVELILRDGTKRAIEVRDIETYDYLKGYVTIEMKDNDFGPYELHSTVTIPIFEAWLQESETGTQSMSGSFAVSSVPNLTITDIQNLNIDSLPPITIADIVSLNIDSVPPLSVNQTLSASTPPMTQVNIGTTSQTLLAANANRKQIELFNQHSSQPIFFFLGSPATLTNGRMLDPGEKYEFPRGLVYTGIITAISSGSGTKPISVTEWT